MTSVEGDRAAAPGVAHIELVGVGLVAALAAFGFHRSRGGRPIPRDRAAV